MRLRTFTAPDMPAAMRLVRESLGDDAIILSTSGGAGKKSISVTAAVDMLEDGEEWIKNVPSSFGSTKGSHALDKNSSLKAKDDKKQDAPDLRFEIQTILRFHNVPELFISKLMQKASDTDIQGVVNLHRISRQQNPGDLPRLAMEKILSNYFAFEPLQFEASHRRIMLIGAPGIGKTLTVAKIAARLAMDKQPMAIFTTDNKRAGGIEQLQAFTNILNVPLKVIAEPGELGKALAALPQHTSVVVDTAGCNPYDANELKELKAYASQGGVRPILVMPAGGDSAEAIDMSEAFAQLPITRMLVTRADTARRFGGVIAAATAHGLAFSSSSSSGSIIDPLQPLDAPLLAQLLLRYKQLHT